MKNRYVKILLEKENDVIKKIISYSDDLVEFKTMNNDAYQVDMFGVSATIYSVYRELILDLYYEIPKQVNKYAVIQRTYDKYLNLYVDYKNKLRLKKLERLLDNEDIK